jgi:membrane fusion protein, epimerase transport system
LIRRQIEATQDEIRARDSQLAADSRAIRVQREDLEANQRLLTAGFVSQARLLALQRSVSELESRHADTRAERALAESRTTDLRLRAETLQDSFMQEAAGLFAQVSAQIFDLRDRLRPLEDASMRQHITAPISGEVVDLRVTGPGTVIAPREPILDIVPAGAELIVEARVQPADISQVHAGQTADVRLTAFRMRITPTVEGKVSYVSADSLFDQATKSTYYLARIRVTEAALMEAGGLRLQAGMPAEVYIRTTERTPLQYLLDPVNAFLQRAMREH